MSQILLMRGEYQDSSSLEAARVTAQAWVRLACTGLGIALVYDIEARLLRAGLDVFVLPCHLRFKYNDPDHLLSVTKIHI